jgi:RimJ/RimL family protein N-acetyltransferase
VTRPLRSDRLDLEPVTSAHADEMVTVLADPRLYTFTGGEPPSLDVLRTRFARQGAGISPDGRENWHTWIVRERATGAAIGFVQATIGATAGSSSAGADTVATPFDGASSAELAWVVGTAYQGRGFATEAIATVADAVRGLGSLTGDDVTLVHAHIAPGHAASESVARHLGLVPTSVVLDGETRWELSV